MNDLPLLVSLLTLGFFGGFSHCIGMCGPFVLTQVSNRLQKTSLENFSNFQKLKNLALLPYHLGRITTYSLIGFFCSFFTKNIQDFSQFKFLSAIFLFAASLFFLNLFLEKNFFAKLRIALPFKSITLKNTAVFFGFFQPFFSKKISFLFQNPQGLRGYILGLVLGFIPCGLLYGAFLIAAAIANPLLAASGMFLFGLATFPALFFTAISGHILLKFSELRIIAKAVILLNAIMLFLMSLKLVL